LAETLDLFTLAKHFSDEESAWLLMESIRWPEDEKACPHCGTIGQHYFLAPQSQRRATSTFRISYRRVWKCSQKDCRKKFSVLVGTICEGSKIVPTKWLLGIYLMCSGNNGVSALELSRQLGITAKSAWHLGHRIRLAMTREPLASRMTGIVEADESYVGGQKPGHRRADRPKVTNEKPIRLPGVDPGEDGDSDEFKDLLADLLATGPSPREGEKTTSSRSDTAG
jgi:hypothetical protein